MCISGSASRVPRAQRASRSAPPSSPLPQPASGLLGKVGDEQVCSGSPYGGEDLENYALLVDPTVNPRSPDHGVLPADIVGGDGKVEPGAGPHDDVKVRQGG